MPLLKTPDWSLERDTSKPSLGNRVIMFIERLCNMPDGPRVGQPFILDEFQKQFILEVYDNPHGTRLAILSIARKNGKTGLIAGLALAHLVGPVAKVNSQIISGAMSRDQAAIVFDYMQKIISVSPELQGLVQITPSRKEAHSARSGTKYKAIAADGKTAQGLNPALVILDEAGQIEGPQSAFVSALETSQGAQESPLMIVISTQSAQDADWLSTKIDDALNRAEGEFDPNIVCHLYTVNPEDVEDGEGLADPEIWRQANPALGSFRSVKDMEVQSRNAVRMPSFRNTFKNLNLNMRVTRDSPFVTADVWRQNALPPYSLDQKEWANLEIYGGLDLSQCQDLTAFVMIGVDPETDSIHVHPVLFTPEAGLEERAKRDGAPYDVWAESGHLIVCPGSNVEYATVVGVIEDMTRGLPLINIAFDRFRIDFLKKDMVKAGLDFPLLAWGQGSKTMGPSLDALEAALSAGRVRHGNHPVLTMCALNARTHANATGDRILVKPKSGRRIDGLQALAMAVGCWKKSDSGQESGEYDTYAF